jgi:hypothetical protein
MIACGETLTELCERFSLVMDRSRHVLQEKITKIPNWPRHHRGIFRRFLFPDAAVYSTKKESSGALETLAAQEYLLTLIAKLGGRPRYLSSMASTYLQRMEAEQYRQNLL